jgi:two-component system phosphate regulon sensor histidine kinase PhoR
LNVILSQEFLRVVILLLLSWAVGNAVGAPFVAVSICLAALVIWHTFSLSNALHWLAQKNEHSPPPEGLGVWAKLFDRLYNMQRENYAERRRLTANIEYFERSFSAMPDAVVIANDRWQIDWCNAACDTLLGLRPSRDIGHSVTSLIRQPEFLHYIEQRDFENALYITSPLNEAMELEVRMTPFGDNEHLMFARDVTKIRQLNKMRKDFTDNVSHELRTPLTVINGYLETMLGHQDLIDPKLHRALNQMQAQGERMESLISDIIWLSRLESVPVEFDELPIKVVDLAEQLKNEALELAGVERVIDINADADLLLKGSQREIYSAFSNIVFNAIKYTPADAVITLRWQKTSFGAIFSVKDTGPGIAVEHISRLTERFYRVDDSRASTTGGTGLGLAIAKHILQRHGGDLRITSVLSHGSTFTCHFPAARVVFVEDCQSKLL